MNKQSFKTLIHKSLVACVYAVISFNLVFSIIDLVSELDYNPGRRMAWLALSSALLAVALIVDRLTSQREKIWLLIHLIAYPAILIIIVGSAGMNWFGYLLASAVLVLSGILFYRANGTKRWKVCIEIFTAFLAVPTLIFFLFGMLFGSFGSISSRIFVSPGGMYEAEVRIVDEGALGGSTSVSVYRVGTRLHLPFGTLSRPLDQYHLDWIAPKDLDDVWETDDVIAVNGNSWRWQHS